MPSSKEQKTCYEQNKSDYQELIHELLGDHFGRSPHVLSKREYKMSQRSSVLLRDKRKGTEDGIFKNDDPYEKHDDKSLRTSSEKAIKALFEDEELGPLAFNYLQGLKSDKVQGLQGERDKTPEEIQADREKFQERAADTRNLLASNKRDLSMKDSFSANAVGEANANKNRALAAGATVAAVGATAATGGIAAAVIGSSIAATYGVGGAIITSVMGAYGTMIPAAVLGTEVVERTDRAVGVRSSKQKTVTKIKPGKTVNPASADIDDDYKTQMNDYAERELGYEDLLYKKMTGNDSPKYEASLSKSEKEQSYKQMIKDERALKEKVGGLVLS